MEQLTKKEAVFMKKWNEVTAQEKAWFLDEAVNHGAIEITREEVPHKLQQDCFNYLLRNYTPLAIAAMAAQQGYNFNPYDEWFAKIADGWKSALVSYDEDGAAKRMNEIFLENAQELFDWNAEEKYWDLDEEE